MVAQASSLLYRRFPIGKASPVLHFRQIRRDCRLEALRYSRLETCATLSYRDFVTRPAGVQQLKAFLLDIWEKRLIVKLLPMGNWCAAFMIRYSFNPRSARGLWIYRHS